jgi:hypothetical protein
MPHLAGARWAVAIAANIMATPITAAIVVINIPTMADRLADGADAVRSYAVQLIQQGYRTDSS